MPRQRMSRIYGRVRGGETRFYGDFRDMGGGREALIPDGETQATTDPDVAAKIAAARVEELERGRRGVHLIGVGEEVGLEAYADTHLLLKREEGASERHLEMLEGQLTRAVQYFGQERPLTAITTGHLKEWVRALELRSNGRGGRLTKATVRKHLNAISDLYARAVSDGKALTNPARDLYGKPRPEKRPARYWEPHEVALLLESARTLPTETVHHGRGSGGRVSSHRYPWIHPLLATAALTGLRKSELFGLLVEDVSFKLGRIFVRPNEWRDLKNDGSERDVPLWPQLEGILRAYLEARERPPFGLSLLFPSDRPGEEKLLDNVDRALDAIGERVEIRRPRLHAFRHSYTAARIQTLEHGAPVSLFQVARELGHSTTEMIERRYGHLARVKVRKEVVEFRVENHESELEERLRTIR